MVNGLRYCSTLPSRWCYRHTKQWLVDSFVHLFQNYVFYDLTVINSSHTGILFHNVSSVYLYIHKPSFYIYIQYVIAHEVTWISKTNRSKTQEHNYENIMGNSQAKKIQAVTKIHIKQRLNPTQMYTGLRNVRQYLQYTRHYCTMESLLRGREKVRKRTCCWW